MASSFGMYPTAIDASELFESVVQPDGSRQPKPAPDLYRQVALELDMAPSDCLALEDTPSGCAAARRAGMHVLAIGRRAREQGDADHYADDMEHARQRLLDLLA